MNEQKISELKNQLSGVVAVPGDEIYTKASTMLFYTATPCVVVRPETNDDVVTVIRFAKENTIPLAIRSGGHGGVAARLPENVLLIDMSGLASIDVLDAEKGIVRVGGGALWHEVATTLEPYKLGISSGDTRTVGVGGLATGGGLGWGIRKYGPVVDHILSLEIVTADGRALTASEDENVDLFWAVRGGGSNFGVVTHFTFRAHKIEGIFAGKITYPLTEVAQTIKAWRNAMRTAPAELTTMLLTMPPMGDAPGTILIHGCFEGTDEATAAKAYEPFLRLGKLTHSEVTPMPYKNILEDGMPIANIRVISHADYIKEFSDEIIDALAKCYADDVMPVLQIRHIAGAISEKGAEATSFSHRDCEVLVVHPSFFAPDASADDIEKGLKTWHTIESFSAGEYLNLLSDDDGRDVQKGYSPEAFERLQKLKAQYDPDNIFNTNFNIPPAK